MRLSRRQSIKAMATAAALEVPPRKAFAAATPVRLIVLDIGGTIIQDRGDVPQALQGAFAKRGMKVTAEEIALWRGASKREVVRHFLGGRSTATGADRDKLVDAIYADFNAHVIQVYKDVPPIAGAEAAFGKLLGSGHLLASSTGFGREIAASIFRRLGWEKYFAAMISSDDVAQGRPSPYMIFHAMETAHVSSVRKLWWWATRRSTCRRGQTPECGAWWVCCPGLQKKNGFGRNPIQIFWRAWRICRR